MDIHVPFSYKRYVQCSPPPTHMLTLADMICTSSCSHSVMPLLDYRFRIHPSGKSGKFLKVARGTGFLCLGKAFLASGTHFRATTRTKRDTASMKSTYQRATERLRKRNSSACDVTATIESVHPLAFPRVSIYTNRSKRLTWTPRKRKVLLGVEPRYFGGTETSSKPNILTVG